MPTTAAIIGRSSFSIAALLLIALIAHAAGCTRRFPTTEVTPIKAANTAELQRYLLSRKPDVAQFRFRGPFAMVERRELEIPLDPDLTVTADLYLCAAASKAPLVIVLHGNNNSKEDHAFQAMHLASWGMHGLALDLPKPTDKVFSVLLVNDDPLLFNPSDHHMVQCPGTIQSSLPRHTV